MLARARSLETFQNMLSVRSKGTQKNYSYALANFKKFCKTAYKGRDVEEIIHDMTLEKNTDVLLDVLQTWINSNSKLAFGTVRGYVSCVSNYLFYRGVRLDQRDLKLLKLPKKLEEEFHPISEEEIKKIMSVAKYEKRALYFALLSSGMRPFEALNIRKRDLDLTMERIAIRVPAKYTKLRRARTTFLSVEAAKFLNLSKMNDDDYVWESKAKNLVICEDLTFSRYRKKVGLVERYESTGRYKINLYSFRAFFITKLSRHDENFAKKLAGQKGYLLQYDRMTDKEKLELYLKVEPDLLIFDTTKKDQKIKELEEKNKQIDDLKLQLEQLSHKVKRMENGE